MNDHGIDVVTISRVFDRVDFAANRDEFRIRRKRADGAVDVGLVRLGDFR